MLTKICGMKYPENIAAIGELPINFLGFIFHANSPRNIGNFLGINTLNKMTSNVKKVGVFVNASVQEIQFVSRNFPLDYIQLHGDETPDFCLQMKELNFRVVKAFHIDSSFDFTTPDAYAPHCDYFLFDTKSIDYGGSGKTFEWELLDNYQLSIPFFLSGGIGLENIDAALALSHPQLAGIDINSKVEIAPGLKSVDLAAKIVAKIKEKTL